MKNLLLKHYELIKQRGLIHPGTTMGDFMMKLEEEFNEVNNAWIDDIWARSEPSAEFFQECTDLVMVVLNMMQHYNVDFREELNKNIRIQESRVINIVSKQPND